MVEKLYYHLAKRGGYVNTSLQELAQAIGSSSQEVAAALIRLKHDGMIELISVDEEGRVELKVLPPVRDNVDAAAKVLESAFYEAKSKRELKRLIKLALELLGVPIWTNRQL